MERKSVIERRIRQLEQELQELGKFGEDVYADGTVIKFKYRFSVNHLRRAPRLRNDYGGYDPAPVIDRPWYTYYACKIKGGWYLSGRSSARLDWDELVAMWTDGEVRKMRIATGWARLDGTVSD